MMINPLRLILSGYVIATVAGIVTVATGAGVLSALLTIWIGGAICVLALAAASTRIAPGFRVRSVPPEAASDFHADLQRWETDRTADAVNFEIGRAVVDDQSSAFR